jgi:divalent metal cation (Fe/Co/Zn/Cd) transporter
LAQTGSNPTDTGNISDRQRWIRLGLWLLVATIVYNAVEAIIALWAGARAGSIALVGFGFDSIIELAAAAVVLWRFSVEARGSGAEAIERAERRVHRFVGLTFFLLAAYVLLQSAWDLWAREAPSESLVGIVVAAISLVVMPLVAMWKLRVADAIGSASLRAEAKETIACSYLSFCLLAGLAANALAGWWWADPVAALLMVPWLIREGKEGWEGEGCCSHE